MHWFRSRTYCASNKELFYSILFICLRASMGQERLHSSHSLESYKGSFFIKIDVSKFVNELTCIQNRKTVAWTKCEKITNCTFCNLLRSLQTFYIQYAAFFQNFYVRAYTSFNLHFVLYISISIVGFISSYCCCR